MSKIEDALNKAKKHNATQSNNVAIISTNKTISSIGNESNNNVSVIQREAVSKEIALMENEYLYDPNELQNLKIISPEMTDKKIGNIFRDLRTKILQKCKSNNFIVMVTSCSAGDLNGSTLLNLASAFSFIDTQTSLVIDCDLKQSDLNQKLNRGASIGLVDYLEDESIDVESIIRTCSDAFSPSPVTNVNIADTNHSSCRPLTERYAISNSFASRTENCPCLFTVVTVST